jgi:hypothetical protein
MAKHNVREEILYQIRLTRGEAKMWSWTVWEWNQGFKSIKYLPMHQLMGAKAAFDAAAKWCNENGIEVS